MNELNLVKLSCNEALPESQIFVPFGAMSRNERSKQNTQLVDAFHEFSLRHRNAHIAQRHPRSPVGGIVR